jgi:hypothetical protein
MTEPLSTRADLATLLRCSDRTVRRIISQVAATTPGFAPIKRGRAMLFTRRDIDMITEALRCPSTYVAEARYGTHGARSVSAVRSSPSPSSALALVRELTRKPPPRLKKRASEPTRLTVLTGGRDASR